MEAIILGIILSIFAGLSTTLGSIIVLVFKNPGPKFITLALSFSAGIMIFISFVELLQEGIEALGVMLGMLIFLLGMAIMYGIDNLVSHRYEFEGKFLIDQSGQFITSENPKQSKNLHGLQQTEHHRQRRHRRRRRHHQNKLALEKTSFLVVIGIFIHNLPEGIATLAGTLKDPELGILLATAIAIHNIPEGIIVAASISVTSGEFKKAFFWSFISGISEPLGALLAGFILLPFINDIFIAGLLAAVAGIMIFISLDELLPMSNNYKLEHLTILGLMLGFLVMGISLAIL